MKLVKTENEDSSIMKSTLRYTFVAPGSIGKGRGRGLGLKSLGEKGNMPAKKLFSQSNDLVNHYIQEIETRKTRGIGHKSSTMSSSQGMETMHKNSLALEKENMKINIPSPTCANQVKKYTKEVEISTTRKGIEQRTESTMSSKSTRSNTTKSSGQEMRKMDRHPLHKFESVDMNDHRDHILRWMNELWNKWRGHLHAKYVKDKPIQQSLRNIPRGVDKKEWEWLVKEHFASESFQARSSRNATNRAKLTMLHHIGSKPIREIIYQKGGKDGNPPDLATIFFETRKKDNKLVEPEAIEKHAQLQEIVQANPSLPSIEIVEKCCGPQTRSHVFGFGGGVKTNDLKGGTSSKAELFSALRSTREDNKSLNEENKFLNEENKSLNDRLSTLENAMKEIMKMKEFIATQQSHVHLRHLLFQLNDLYFFVDQLLLLFLDNTW
ncbi:hypothetical protein AABB24_005157 [Solanum stoloniferum]|uniref:Uncharacterized protein n=1 Tax=Solanum stoloniferum TaxID=62892 RepID=A0ABD2UVW3_9SOLN